MKKAKKLISVMLVLIMALSLMNFVSAKPADMNVDDYSDADKIEYKEAVDVLTALGVLLGRDDGTFDPAAQIKRSEAAKIITYVLIGKAAADKLGHSPTSFSDVADNHWANPFIEYCAANGIINGYGDGRFGPDDDVTAAQMAKMLLIALGYGKQDEYVGTRWQLFAISDGQKLGILTTDADYTAPATREEVAQYTFNAIAKVKMVTFNQILGNYFENDNNVFGGQSYWLWLGDKTFGLGSVPQPDKFGLNMHYWKAGTKTLTNLYDSDIVIGEVQTTRNNTQHWMATNYSWNVNGVEVWINGTRFYTDGAATANATNPNILWPTDTLAVRGATTILPYLPIVGVGNVPLVGGFNLKFVDVFNPQNGFDGVVDKVIITYEYLAEVTSVNAAAGTLQVTRFDSQGSAIRASVIVAEGFAKGDYVLIVEKEVSNAPGNPNDAVQPLRIVKANVETVQITKYTTTPAPTLTIDGNTYNMASTLDVMTAGTRTAVNGGFSAALFNKDITVYMDSYNQIIGYRAPVVSAGSLDYLFVRSADARDGTNLLLNRVAIASIVYSNGKTDFLNLPFDTTDPTKIVYYNAAGTPVTVGANTTDVTAAFANHWFSYTMNADGTVNLFALRSEAIEIVTNTHAVRLFGGMPTVQYGNTAAYTASLATSSTILSVVANSVQKTYTGYTNFPGTSGSPSLYTTNNLVDTTMVRSLVILGADARISHIYVLNGMAAPTPVYGVVINIWDDTTVDGVSHEVLTDTGDKITVARTAALAVNTIVTISETTSGIKIENATAPTAPTYYVANAAVGQTDEAGYFMDGSALRIYASNCVFYNSLTGEIMDEAMPQEGQNINYLYTTNTTTTVDTVYAVVIIP